MEDYFSHKISRVFSSVFNKLLKGELQLSPSVMLISKSITNINVSKTYPFCPFQDTAAAGSAARRTTTCLTPTRSTSTLSSVSCRQGRQERLQLSIHCCSTRTRGLRRSRCMRSPSSSIIPLLQSISPTPSVSSWFFHSNNPLKSCQLAVFSSFYRIQLLTKYF